MSLKLPQPAPLPFDMADWQKRPFHERVKMLCQAWAVQGYGAPWPIYLFYVLKGAVCIWLWFLACGYSAQLGTVGQFSEWWFQPEALIKGVLLMIACENLGFGCGSGPLTSRFFPPFAAFLHYFRPGTVKLPFIPGLPIVGGDTRTWFDVVLFAAHIGFLVRALVAPEITPELLLPSVILLPILGLTDRTIFLSARAEHYWLVLVCFLFPLDAIAGTKMVWFGVWFWAAMSKTNIHFPTVTCVMLSNSAVMRFKWVRKKLYRNYPDDLRPSKFNVFLTHFGTTVEFLFPILLMAGSGGEFTNIALLIMLCFHIFITSHVPMAAPIMWNVIMVYGAFILFGHNADVSIFTVQSPVIWGALFVGILAIPIFGNLYPKHVSFLMSMRYYAGNWPMSIWLFKNNCDEKMDTHIKKASLSLKKQLMQLYDEDTANALMSRFISFRCMHFHGRLLQLLLPKAVDNIEEYTWREGEVIAGIVLGWNFGDGHLHQETLLKAVQKRCNYASGELRVIMVESQPFGRNYMDWRIVDAKDGELESGRATIEELKGLQPYPVNPISPSDRVT